MNITRKALSAAKAAAICLTAVLVLLYPTETAQSTVSSINVCINSIIPSMFAFMVISSYIQSSGLYRVILRPFLFIFRHLIKAEDDLISIFLLSLFGGYPIGVKLLSENTAQNNNFPEIRHISENASSFCYCISPTFALIMLGQGVFGSTSAGAVIYISNVLACLTVGITVSRISDLRGNIQDNSAPHTLIDAVNSASRSLFLICTVIISFNIALTCATSLSASLGVTVSPLILGVFEISNLLKLPVVSASYIPLVSAIASTGGICVLLQCTAIVKGAFHVGKFLLARIPCALLSALYSFLILQFTEISVEASAISENYSYTFSTDKIIVLILIAMCIIIFYKSDKIHKKV